MPFLFFQGSRIVYIKFEKGQLIIRVSPYLYSLSLSKSYNNVCFRFGSNNKIIMNKVIIFILAIPLIFGAGFWYRSYRVSAVKEKIYVAIEGEAKIAVIDAATKKVIRNIDLSVEHDGGLLSFAPHNVQVSPDQKSVWVTANAGKHQEHSSYLFNQASAHGEEEEGAVEADQVIIIDPLTDKIIEWIPIARSIHLAHVVLTPDTRFAYATAQEEGAVYKINTDNHAVKRIEMPLKSEPHGLRISPDGLTAYIAMLGGKSLGVIDLRTDILSEIPLGGQAVQTGVTPDGKYAVASLYDVKKLAVYNTADRTVSFISLPESSRGPIQMYPTPDSRFIYLADQGYYFNQPTGEWVYKIELASAKVVKEIKAGSAPHGVVVSHDGNFVYVTNLLSGDVSVIDTAKDEEVGRIKVGEA